MSGWSLASIGPCPTLAMRGHYCGDDGIGGARRERRAPPRSTPVDGEEDQLPRLSLEGHVTDDLFVHEDRVGLHVEQPGPGTVELRRVDDAARFPAQRVHRRDDRPGA